MFTLRLLGGFALEGPAGEPVHQLPQRRAEAVLAVLAAAGRVGCTRDRLVALLWPESEEARARHNLREILHAIRQALGPDALLTPGDRLHLNPSVITSDVEQLAAGLRAPSLEDAAHAYRGPFLDGFHIDEAPEFERWVEGERARLSRECLEALERLARAAEAGERWSAAASWWGRAVELDPYNTRVAVRRMRALVAAGDRGNALHEAEAHTRRLLRDLELEPDPAFLEEIARLRDGGMGPSRFTTPPDRRASPGSPPLLRAPDAEHVLPSPPSAAAPLERGAARQAPRRLWLVAAAMTVLIVAVLAAAILRLRRPGAARELDQRLVSVLPVSTPAGDTALERLAAQLGSFMEHELGEGPPLSAAEPALVRAAWRRFAGADSATDWRAMEEAIAQTTNAALHVHTSLERADGRFGLTLRLDAMPGGRVHSVRHLVLRPESLEAGARVLLLEAQAEHLGQPAHRIAWLARRDPQAARLFLQGPDPPGYSPGCRGWVGRVLERDSGLVQAMDACFYSAGIYPYLGRFAWHDTLARWAWRRRSGLPPEDRAFVEALYGPRVGLAPDEEVRIALWQRAAEAAETWESPWTKLATELATFGPLTSIPDWRNRARDAFEHAVALCDTGCDEAVTFGFWFWLFDGDTVTAKTLLAAAQRRGLQGALLYGRMSHLRHALAMARPGSGTDRYWEQAVRKGDRPGFALRVAFAATQALPRGAPSADLAAERFRAMTVDRPPARGFLDSWLANYWRTRGRYARWLEARGRYYLFNVRQAASFLDAIYNDALVIQEVTYLGAPEDRHLAEATGRMERIVRGDTAATPGAVGIARCWLSQWRLARGDTSGVRSAIAFLRELERRDRAGLQDGMPGGQRWVICPAVLEAQLARVTGRDALAKARALNALLQPMPLPPRGFADAVDGSATHDQMRFIDNLLAAWLLAAAGDTAAALQAARRRAWDIQLLDLTYALPEYLRAEGRYAAAMVDTLGAIAAYEHYLGLRSEPPDYAPWRADWDSVRTALAALRAQRRG